jgi:hypothetical protein
MFSTFYGILICANEDRKFYLRKGVSSTGFCGFIDKGLVESGIFNLE